MAWLHPFNILKIVIHLDNYIGGNKSDNGIHIGESGFFYTGQEVGSRSAKTR